MEILVIGGTRYFGKHMVDALLEQGHHVTIATRGQAQDPFDDRVERIVFDRTDVQSVKQALSGKWYDVVIDNIAYCSNEIAYALDVLECDKYIYMSTTAVYEPKHWDTKEEEFDPLEKELVWCSRGDYPYDEIKRQAECALRQVYGKVNAIAVRYPFVIGTDDYTKRLYFYVEHAIKQIPMHINNLNGQMGFIRSDEAGRFLAFLAEKEFAGAINGCSEGTISIGEILEYIMQKTGKAALLSDEGEEAPYNNEPEYSIISDRAKALGFQFTDLKSWIYELIDVYIEEVEKNKKTE